MLTNGKRRGKKPGGIEGEVIVAFDEALESIAEEIEVAILRLSKNNVNTEEVTDVLRCSARHLACLIIVAKGFHVRSKRSEHRMRREFQSN
jgi:hypothetical protein